MRPTALLCSPALAVLLTTATLAQGVPRQASDGKLTWPAISGWTTVFFPKTARSDTVCVTSYTAGTISSTQAVFSISLNSSATHFYAMFGGEDFPAGSSLRIYGDGTPILDAPILSHEDVRGFGHEIMADLPGSELVDTLGPALMRSNTMQVDFGGHRFTARLNDFRPVAMQIKDCALTQQRLYPRQ